MTCTTNHPTIQIMNTIQRPWIGLLLAAAVALLTAPPLAAAPEPSPQCTPAPQGNDSLSYPTCTSGPRVGPYKCWQRSLTATSTYANAYRDVKLKVTFTLGTSSFWVYAYWNGGQSFVFRASFNQLGTWKWKATCEAGGCTADSGLKQEGSVSVDLVGEPDYQPNPLYAHGPLHARYTGALPPGVPRPFIHPEHEDGTPFLWHGDTAWAATYRAFHSEWRTYIDDRRARGISVVQLGLGASWVGPPTSGSPSGPDMQLSIRNQAPFVQISSNCSPSSLKVPNNCSRWNPDFWNKLAGMVQYANDNWIVVLIAGIMDPVGHCSASDPSTCPPVEEAQVFARNLTSLLAGNHVILSPSWDHQASTNWVTRMDTVAGSIYRHLKTNHIGTRESNEYAEFHEKPWLGFQLFQSGHNNGNLDPVTRRPREMPPVLRGWDSNGPDPFSDTPKSLVNGEAIYDYGKDPAAPSPSHFNGFRARQVGWLSWLTGTKGYTWGASGLWEWGICGLNPRPGWATTECTATGIPEPESCFKDYAGAMPSANHVQRLRDALSILDWNSLIQNEQWRVHLQSSEESTKMVVARDADILVAYLPYNFAVTLDLNGAGVEPMTSGLMWSPRYPGEGTASFTKLDLGGGVYEYRNPDGLGPSIGSDDWVLALFRSTAEAASSDWSTEPGLDVTPGVTAAGRAGLFGRFRVPGSLTENPRRLIREEGTVWPARIRTARDGNGQFIVTWEHRDSAISPSRIGLALFDRAANPRQGVGEIPPPSNGSDQLHPAVATDRSGRFFVAWEEPTGPNAPNLLLRAFDRWGFAIGPVVPLVSTEPGKPEKPRAACAENGNCVVAWAHRSDIDGRRSIRVQPLDVSGILDGIEFEATSPATEKFWLTHTSVTPSGEIELRWESFDAREQSMGTWRMIVDRHGRTVASASLVAPAPVRP